MPATLVLPLWYMTGVVGIHTTWTTTHSSAHILSVLPFSFVALRSQFNSLCYVYHWGNQADTTRGRNYYYIFEIYTHCRSNNVLLHGTRDYAPTLYGSWSSSVSLAGQHSSATIWSPVHQVYGMGQRIRYVFSLRFPSFNNNFVTVPRLTVFNWPAWAARLDFEQS